MGTVTTFSGVTDQSRKKVSTELVVRRSKEKEKKVYAFFGWNERQARSQTQRGRLAKRWYRKRFGIETTYRQMNQAKVTTSKKDVRYRLLLIGLALLLRQAWVWLTAQVAHDWGLCPSANVPALRLTQMVEWLADSLKQTYEQQLVILLATPLLPIDGCIL